VSNFAARISSVAAAKPNQTAVEQVHADGSLEATTYGALDAFAGRVAAWLLASGVRAGDRAAVLADNGADWIGTYLGVLRIGAVAVPLDTAYKSAQVRTVLENSGARLLFTTPRYLDTARDAVASGGPGSARIVLMNGNSPGVVDASAFAAAGNAPPVAPVAPTDAAVILYTSGTTSDPKGVVLTHHNLDAEREGAFAIVRVTETDAILGVLPLFHALAQMANLLLPLAVGARVVFLDTVSSTSLVSALSSRGITIFACVPQFFYLIHQRITGEVRKRGALARLFLRVVLGANVWLRDHTGLNPAKRVFGRAHRMLGERMRLFVTGGSKFDPSIARDLYGLGFTILNAYGLTETSGGATIVRPGDRLNESVGQPFPGVEIRIEKRERERSGASSEVRAERSELAGVHGAPGDEQIDGEVLIRGPIIMREYFNRPDATAEALKDGWLHTGDLGRLDAQGRLYITGRQKEIIVLASGKNLYPEEIEAHYRQSMFIKELCVLGIARPDEPASERLHAIVVPDDAVLKEKGIVNLRELLRFEIEGLSVQLPAHKRILSYDVSLEPLPRTTTGKLRRHEIQRRLRDRATDETRTARRETADESSWRAVPARAEALQVIARKLDREAVLPDANLELDLGLDSMERVELLTLLEQRAGTRVTADARATIFTVRQLVEAVETAPAVAQAAPDEAGGELAWHSILSAPADPAITADLARKRWVTAIVSFVFLRSVALLLRITPGLRISGHEHLPKDGGFLISPNHQAYIDPFFLAAALPFRTLRQLFFVGASEYFETPLLKRMARAVNLIPVDPDANLINAMQAGAAGLRLGKALVLFPEGERTIDGDLKKFRKGASILSAHLDVPIVPVAIDGLFELWPRGRSFNWRGLLPGRATPVRIAFGPPVRVAPGAYTEGTAALRSAVAAMLDGMRAGSKTRPPE
jgi:long-chain acyl-CoA synthetase